MRDVAVERSTPQNLVTTDQNATHTDPMDPSTRRELENTAAGAGHAVDLSADEPDVSEG